MAGIDMSMVPYDFSFCDYLLELVKEGSVPESRINEAEILTMPAAEGTYLTKRPFNASSDLSKFGKQEVYAENQPQASESYLSPQEIGDF
jgi:beta-glucosidase